MAQSRQSRDIIPPALFRSTSWLADSSLRARLLLGLTLVVILLAAIAGFTALQKAQIDQATTQATINLKPGQTEVPLDKRLVVTLNHAAKLDAFKAAFAISGSTDGDSAAGELTASSDLRKFTWTPSHPWADLTTYTVHLATFKDSLGRRVAAHDWRFTTTIVPRIMSLKTDAGISIGDDSEVALGSGLTAVFNAAMDQAASGILVNGGPAELKWSTDGQSAAISTKDLRAGPVELAVAPGGRDLAGHSLSTDWKLRIHWVYQVKVATTELPSIALVQVPNDPMSRDQSGLQAADIIYEYATEGGITRFTALFTRAPDVVGPIRSGRLIAFKLTRHYQGVLFLSGLSEGSMARLRADTVPAIFDDDGFFYRTRDRVAPYNLYTGGKQLLAADTKWWTNIKSKLGSGSQPAFPQDAPTLDVPEHSAHYAFDPITGTYSKSEQGHTFSDALVAQPLHIQMVLVLHTHATATNYVEDVNGARGLDFDLENGGRAEFYSGGKMATGKWAGTDRNAPLSYMTDDGKPLILPRGLVWVDVVTS